VLDLPRLLAQLRLSQSRPRLTAFKQLANSINQLLQLQQMVAALAPAAAAQAAAGGGGGDGGTHQQQRNAGYGRASAVSIFCKDLRTPADNILNCTPPAAVARQMLVIWQGHCGEQRSCVLLLEASLIIEAAASV
jgi:hypothetical protein